MEGKVEYALANEYQIKHIPGKKNDVLDSDGLSNVESQNMLQIFHSIPRSWICGTIIT